MYVRRSAFLLALLLHGLAGCRASAPQALISLSAPARVEHYDLYVRDDTSRALLLHTGWSDATLAGTRDLSTAPFKIGLRLTAAGHYTAVVVGAIGPLAGTRPDVAKGARQFFWAATFEVKGERTIAARLVEVPPGDDDDGDIFPDGAVWPAHTPEAATFPLALLDCADKPMPGIAAALINPFAREVCGNALDDDCDGADAPCEDADGDGDPDATDCAPADPAIHHATSADPFPESANCCGYSLGKGGTPDGAKSFASDKTCHAATCGDGIDQDCDHLDLPCKRDQDCDSYGAGTQPPGCMAPQGAPADPDCNDCDPLIGPLAAEVCDGKDNNCNGRVDEACVGCDLDGDGYQRSDGKNGCPDAAYLKTGKAVDCNDEDSGVYPGSTVKTAGMEGGTALGAMRGLCRREAVDGTPQDADCDGKITGCLDAFCDADRDGFIDEAKAAQCDPGAKYAHDCNDADPQIFPGAPELCGDLVAQNCVQDAACAIDADGDKYDKSVDCNDGDKAIHPWAIERCNGVDDDCDGLVDEGNPDAAGKPLTDGGHVLRCSDSDVGACAAPLGDCVCSAASIASANFDQAKRHACPGETAEVDTGAKATQAAARCYFAAQPTPEVCNAVDDDCNPASPDGKSDCPGGAMLAPLCCAALGCKAVVADVAHCGGCGVVCKVANATASCSGGLCAVKQCNGGFGDCNGMASDGCETSVAADIENCGACGAKCVGMGNQAASCSSGVCGVGSCDAPFKDCNGKPADGCEVNTASDLKHCGACMAPCAMVPNGSPACVAGACGISICTETFRDCDHTLATGCEANISSDLKHCGGCDQPCPAPPNTTAACMMGKCAPGMCVGAFKDCNANLADGCEIDSSSSPAHCGACNKPCAVANGTPGCAVGKCTVSVCNLGFGDCDKMAPNGCEVNTFTEAKHCGVCGNDCGQSPAGKLCLAGICGCKVAKDDCNPMLANGCTMGACTCGAAAPCNPATLQCTGGKCLLKKDQPCKLDTDCASGKCIPGTLICAK